MKIFSNLLKIASSFREIIPLFENSNFIRANFKRSIKLPENNSVPEKVSLKPLEIF